MSYPMQNFSGDAPPCGSSRMTPAHKDKNSDTSSEVLFRGTHSVSAVSGTFDRTNAWVESSALHSGGYGSCCSGSKKSAAKTAGLAIVAAAAGAFVTSMAYEVSPRCSSDGMPSYSTPVKVAQGVAKASHSAYRGDYLAALSHAQAAISAINAGEAKYGTNLDTSDDTLPVSPRKKQVQTGSFPDW